MLYYIEENLKRYKHWDYEVSSHKSLEQHAVIQSWSGPSCCMDADQAFPMPANTMLRLTGDGYRCQEYSRPATRENRLFWDTFSLEDYRNRPQRLSVDIPRVSSIPGLSPAAASGPPALTRSDKFTQLKIVAALRLTLLIFNPDLLKLPEMPCSDRDGIPLSLFYLILHYKMKEFMRHIKCPNPLSIHSELTVNYPSIFLGGCGAVSTIQPTQL